MPPTASRPEVRPAPRRGLAALALLLVSACAGVATDPLPPAPSAPSAEAIRVSQDRPSEPEVRADINASYLSDQLDPARLDRGFSSESRETYAAREAVTEALGLRPGDVIADVGAGTGIYLAPFSEAVGPDGAVVAVDIAPKLVRYIEARAERDGLANVRAQLGGTADTGLAPGSVDHVFTANVYHHFERPLAMNAHLFGALRPCGTYAVLDFRNGEEASPFVRRHVRQDMATLIEEATAAGFVFEGERVVPGLEENYLAVFRRPPADGVNDPSTTLNGSSPRDPSFEPPFARVSPSDRTAGSAASGTPSPGGEGGRMVRKLLLGAGSAAMLAGCYELPEPPSDPGTDCQDCSPTGSRTGTDTPTDPPSGEVGGTDTGAGGETSADDGAAEPDTDAGADAEAEPDEPQAAPTRQEAARFLVQASFGANPGDVEAVRESGYAAWIDAQAQLPVRSMTERLRQAPKMKRNMIFDVFWNEALGTDDQLRQRVAYALSQIVVVSAKSKISWDRPETITAYMDILQRNALGNYQDLIHEISLSPTMGFYLSSLGNQKADERSGVAPDENYAREVMQLFTIGLEELNPDGTSTGAETYTIEDIKGLASVFTGLYWQNTTFGTGRAQQGSVTAPMASYDEYHEGGPKRFLGTTIDVGTDAEASVRAALDHLLAHQNLAPFVSKQLIQRLVSSNPSPAYVERVSRAFEAGVFERDGRRFGEGRRGDLTATVAAILLDEEARNEQAADRPTHGKVREPAMRYAQFARAFRREGALPMSGAPTDSGPLRHAGASWSLGQQPYAPDSVFGFTRPGYVAPGSWSAQADMVAPQLSLVGGARSVGYINFMAGAVTGRNRDLAFQPDYSAYLPMADDPERLVAALDDLLTYGSLDEVTRDRIIEAVATVPMKADKLDQSRKNRTHLAVLMMVTSPEYGVLR